MITLRPRATIHHTEGGWFRANWHFSFDFYADPENTWFGDLRVFNDDTLVPGAVWPMHPHRDIEGVTYVAEGSFEHADSRGNGGILPPGSVQRATLGYGMEHSEGNHSQTEPMRFIQMWIIPSRRGLEPSIEQRSFSEEARRGRWLPVLVPAAGLWRIGRARQLRMPSQSTRTRPSTPRCSPQDKASRTGSGQAFRAISSWSTVPRRWRATATPASSMRAVRPRSPETLRSRSGLATMVPSSCWSRPGWSTDSRPRLGVKSPDSEAHEVAQLRIRGFAGSVRRAGPAAGRGRTTGGPHLRMPHRPGGQGPRAAGAARPQGLCPRT